MKNAVNKERLVEEFISLVRIDSPSREERAVSVYLKDALKALGADIDEDEAAEKTGGNAGNLLGRIKGNGTGAPAILLNAHMDTVAPGRGIKPVVRDGVIHSGGDTILGSDDKSGISIILEVIRTLKERNLPHGDIEILFTVCEEVGLLGAKHFDVAKLKAAFGYSLDSTHCGSIVYAAPAAHYIKFTIHGKEAHAGVSPERGINAVKIAGKALSEMKLGRIDEETTTNIGIVKGGTATNIVPAKVVLEGEARSHCAEKLRTQTEDMVRCVKEAVAASDKTADPDVQADWDVEIRLDFPSMKLDVSGRTISLFKEAARKRGIEAPLITGGGGSDANIFNSKGIEMAIIGTGMEKVHTNDECIRIEDMEKTANLLLDTLISNYPGN